MAKPKDYMRCPACGRLVETANAVRVDSTLYGRECATKIRANYRLITKRDQT